MHKALLFNRRLWSIFMSAAESQRQSAAAGSPSEHPAISRIFVMRRTVEMQIDPNPEKLKSLIGINCNIAAGLPGAPDRPHRRRSLTVRPRSGL